MCVRSLRPRPLSLLVSSLIAGVALAVAGFPASVVVALTAKSASDAYLDLPSDLETPPPPQRSYLYANDGKTLIATFYDVNRQEVPLNKVAPAARDAIVAAEDARFFEHGGVDMRSVIRAFVANGTDGEVEQGASTLTMQYVRNVLKTNPNLSPQERQDATDDTARRKLQEMRYAAALERKLSKEEILNRYLNISYFGAGAYGIAAASERYFGKAPAKLTLAEAALLAGLVQSPDSDSPIGGDKARALERRGYVLDSMARTGKITAAQAAKAKAEPLRLKPTRLPSGCVAARQDTWGFFCDYVRQWWMGQPEFGPSPQQRERDLFEGGYRIVSSLDPETQKVAQNEVLSVYGYGNDRAAPMAVVQPGTGRVLAMAVNRHYSLKDTTNQLVAGGGSIVGYQAGSTFKMFTMLAALESGRNLATGFNAPGRFMSKYPGGGEAGCGNKWCPRNATPSWMNGYRTMWNGFGRSVNTYFVWLEQQVGADKVVQMAQRLGITFRAESDAKLAKNQAARWGAFTLGVSATMPLDLANAYATVAAEGVHCQPTPVLSIIGPSGDRLPVSNPKCQRVLRPEVARAATDAARCPVGDQSAYGRCDGGTADEVAGILGGRQVAGKTGTSEFDSTASFVGYTPQLAVASIAANPDDPQDYVGSAVQQSVVAAVAQTMAATLSGFPKQKFNPPDARIAFGRRR
ncbi:transglycosylase domain-containing protein [Phytohabitans sp. ZYX-F-186]|uniref:Transglycosylase domain-containing protein n=1 Tax=Phytohabitans maris TaxID=3071409 RepID=A0ABU0ZN14_9ACTN|nr:transglycosylase domain-containing protein [Phytohabitans sp. ZYX-F-186]MDQ7908046.1 transglycosylase domain-containing protein [Phytohabitans sp. ZYX-F-186]